MNRKQIIQIICLWIGIVVFVAMLLFPPWIEHIRIHVNGEEFRSYLKGYHYIFSPPTEGALDFYYTIDFQRLGIQCGIVGLLVGGFLYSFRDDRKDERQAKEKN